MSSHTGHWYVQKTLQEVYGNCRSEDGVTFQQPKHVKILWSITLVFKKFLSGCFPTTISPLPVFSSHPSITKFLLISYTKSFSAFSFLISNQTPWRGFTYNLGWYVLNEVPFLGGILDLVSNFPFTLLPNIAPSSCQVHIQVSINLNHILRRHLDRPW